MKRDQYVGMDVHQATTVVAVVDAEGKLVLETIVATEAAAIRRLIESLSGPLHVTLEETTQAQWLSEVMRDRVAELVVCDPKRNKLLRAGSKGDKKDARELAELIRTGRVRSVYHGHEKTQKLKELVRAYQMFSVDTKRTMLRIKAVYRGRGIRTSGTGVYQAKQRSYWLEQLTEPGLRQRVEWLYAELDHVRQLRKEAKAAVLAEGCRHRAVGLLRTIPQLGPLRAAEIVAIGGTPYRFRTKRQFWSYSGLAVVTHSSAEYELQAGRVVRRNKPIATRGLNRNCNRQLKFLFVSAATAGGVNHPYRDYLQSLQQRGIRPEMARLTLARKIATLALTLWKRGEAFDPKKLNWMTT
jgi:transposase